MRKISLAQQSQESSSSPYFGEMEERTRSAKVRQGKRRSVSFGSTSRFSYESPSKLKELERGFVLDGVCLSHLANDETDRTFPSLNIGIPQYRAVTDRHGASYFKRKGLPTFISSGEEEESKTSMQGRIVDKFLSSSEASAYLSLKEKEGAGYTRKLWGGHTSVPSDPAVVGWHGEEGYRRNTFYLRARQSVFDNDDPFENPQSAVQIHHLRHRTKSAPATIRLMRQKSASVYRSFPVPPSKRPMTAIQPGRETTRQLATGPLI